MRYRLPVSTAFLMLSACVTFIAADVRAAEPASSEWTPLFNGKNLDGWEVWLGVPKGEKKPVGLNNDSKQVFSVVEVDGAPAVRISGEIPGAITTLKEYENYHLRTEFKWGEKNWRENFPRDGGILFHCVGRHGAQGLAWMESIECEVMAGHCGDFFSCYSPLAEVEVSPEIRNLKYYFNLPFRTFQKGGEKLTFDKNKRVLAGKDFEKPAGEWNNVEYYTLGQTCVYLVNGERTMIVENVRRPVDGQEVPLTRGKIQVISEWSELYYRKIDLRPITEIPEELLR